MSVRATIVKCLGASSAVMLFATLGGLLDPHGAASSATILQVIVGAGILGWMIGAAAEHP